MYTIRTFIFLITLTNTWAMAQLPADNKISPPTQKREQHKLKIGENCLCPQMWMPVCGDDQKTYGNSCEAKCARVKYTMGACSKKITK